MSATPFTPPTQAATPPGWYADPANPDGRRYWDGMAWTDRVTSDAPQRRVDVPIGLVVAGYVFAVLVPFLGFVLGIIAERRHNGSGPHHGLWIVSLSVGMFILYLIALSSGSAT